MPSPHAADQKDVGRLSEGMIHDTTRTVGTDDAPALRRRQGFDQAAAVQPVVSSGKSAATLTQLQEDKQGQPLTPRPSTPGTRTLSRSQSAREWAVAAFQVSLHDWVLIATLIFGGCCSNVFALEILVNDAPKSGQMITFAQFVWVALDGLFRHLRWPVVQYFNAWIRGTPFPPQDDDGIPVPAQRSIHTDKAQQKSGSSWPSHSSIWWFIPHLKPRKVPLIRWMLIVIMFFVVSVLNNLSLAYRISVPLHIIFRSGGLVIGMLLGMLLMKKSYSKSQMFSVFIVTIGVIYATTSAKQSASQKSSTKSSSAGSDEAWTAEYAIGIFMLVVALVISSLMGLMQESTYSKYGAQWREGLFYSHFLALPMFLYFKSDILEQIRIFNRSTPIPILQLIHQAEPFIPNSIASVLGHITVPRLWIFLAINTATQFMCISGVHRLTSLSSALTLNFILNLRKFTSLVISVLYFENGFGFEMAIGTSLVLLGTIMYSVSNANTANKKKTEKQRTSPLEATIAPTKNDKSA
ncbi:golgi uridine diphosphate-N- acetylglucosamine transporter [Actinomortierella ambigua]|uniref:Golgi uridine diphosphate-N- acetylglucosamine transporter n=1 Tax=Actinomortierella ambigua TaxID=1343610 RepID=A0A9P6U3Z9_9FUNG|nr:golgi uridine diphosphate-N- acetylglucosamine transporter [Actinomortierella ambigua]